MAEAAPSGLQGLAQLRWAETRGPRKVGVAPALPGVQAAPGVQWKEPGAPARTKQSRGQLQMQEPKKPKPLPLQGWKQTTAPQPAAELVGRPERASTPTLRPMRSRPVAPAATMPAPSPKCSGSSAQGLRARCRRDPDWWTGRLPPLGARDRRSSHRWSWSPSTTASPAGWTETEELEWERTRRGW